MCGGGGDSPLRSSILCNGTYNGFKVVSITISPSEYTLVMTSYLTSDGVVYP